MTNQIEVQREMLDEISVARTLSDDLVSEIESKYLSSVESCIWGKSEPLDAVLCIGLNVIHRRAKKVMEQSRIKSWLCYYELHVDDEIILVHRVIEARTEDEAFEKLAKNDRSGRSFCLQAKGVLCLATESRGVIDCLKGVR